MLLRPCAKCGRLIPYGKSRCPKCEILYEEQQEDNRRAQMRRYNEKRNPKYMRFYKGKHWKACSQAKLQESGYRCEGCGKIATEVHHRTPIQTPDGWESRYDMDGLVAVCHRCHDRFHDRF